MPQATTLEEVGLFKGLKAPELKVFASKLISKSYQKGQEIFREGDQCNRVFIVQTGRLKLFRLSPEGREQILEILKPGDTCACNPCLMPWCCSSFAQALTPTTVWEINRDDYLQMIQKNSKIALNLSRIFAERLKAFSGLLEEVSLKDTQKRLAKLLWNLAEDSGTKTPNGTLITLKLTQENLAARIGSVRETVNRTLKEFEKEGIISLRHRRIFILDDKALKALF